MEDIINLENLSDPEILKSMPIDSNIVRRNNRIHLIYYLEAWANILESKLIGSRESLFIGNTDHITSVRSDQKLTLSK